MSHIPDHPFPTADHLPRAGVDPIDSAADAESFVRYLTARPMRHETIAVVLDQRRRGVAVITVDRTVEPDDVLDVADLVVQLAVECPVVGAVVLASVRPPIAHTPEPTPTTASSATFSTTSTAGSNSTSASPSAVSNCSSGSSSTRT